MLLSSPAARWVSELPQTWPLLQQKFGFLREPIEHVQRTLDQMGVQVGSPTSLLSNPIGMATAILGGTGTVAAHLLETLLVLFYLLVFGETFLRRLVEVLPTFASKREAVEISLQVERDLSAYLLTITVINAVVGGATAGVMWLANVPGPVLWGVVAFCLNFVQILGPFFGIVLFLAVGVISKGPAWGSLVTGRPLLRHPCAGRRDRHTDAAGEPIHHKPRGGDPVFDLLVLDVGRPRSDLVGAHVGDHQDRLRSTATVPRLRASPRRIVGVGLDAGSAGWESASRGSWNLRRWDRGWRVDRNRS